MEHIPVGIKAIPFSSTAILEPLVGIERIVVLKVLFLCGINNPLIRIS